MHRALLVLLATLAVLASSAANVDARGSSFDPARTRLMAKTGSGNALFRGNLPERNGTFVLDELWASMRATEGCGGTCIPEKPGDACVARESVCGVVLTWAVVDLAFSVLCSASFSPTNG